VAGLIEAIAISLSYIPIAINGGANSCEPGVAKAVILSG
jgi:hypothetical protein